MKNLNLKPTIPLLIAVILGFLAVYFANEYITQIERDAFKDLELVEVVASRHDVPKATPINISMVKRKKIPKKYVKDNAVYPKDIELILGRELAYPVRKDDMLLWSDFRGRENRYRGFASIIKEQERALTLRADRVSAVGGFIRPNDHVDIVGTFTGTDGEAQTMTILQNVTVLATGPYTAADVSRMKTAYTWSDMTLLVTKEEAEILIFAQSRGRLMFTLRNPEDIQTTEIPRVGFDTIFGSTAIEEIQEKRTRRVVEVVRGGALSVDR
ncbi:MAG: Flp pilus assembly protein CpaB [Myxococcales bacterium]|nr:Flp pilus assembly protein CpaB [Myxococcales bacterium]